MIPSEDEFKLLLEIEYGTVYLDRFDHAAGDEPATEYRCGKRAVDPQVAESLLKLGCFYALPMPLKNVGTLLTRFILSARGHEILEQTQDARDQQREEWVHVRQALANAGIFTGSVLDGVNWLIDERDRAQGQIKLMEENDKANHDAVDVG